MTKLDTYACDRCRDEFTEEHGKKPLTLVVSDFGETETKHFCVDCAATFWSFMEHIKQYDDLADKLAKETQE